MKPFKTSTHPTSTAVAAKQAKTVSQDQKKGLSE